MATVLLGYAFTGSVLTPTSTIANVTGSAITKSTALGTFVVQTALGYATQPVLQAASGSTTYAAAITSGNYITFDLTVAAGFQVSITGLSLAGARGGASTPRGIGIRSSADGYAADLMPDTPLTTVRPTFATYTASPALSNLTGTVTLRIYVYSQSATAELDDITVTGVVSAIAVPTVLAGGLVEADVLAVALVSVNAAVPTALAGGTAETDTLAVALVSPTSLAVALLETATLAAALITQGEPVTLAVLPSSGVIPFTVTATATAYAAAGAVLSYAFAWGDGATTPAQASATATHQYASSGLYNVVSTVSQVAAAGAPTDLGGRLSEADVVATVLRTSLVFPVQLFESDTLAAVLISATAGATFGWQLTPASTGLSGAGIDRNTLATYTGGTPVAGQTITLRKITSSWDLAGWNGGSDNGPQIANVTFDRCWFSVPLDRCGQFGPNNLLVDCDIVGPGTSPNAYGPLVSGGVTTPAIFRRCFLDNFTIGLWLDGAATVDGCYLTSLTVDPNAHVDGITRRGSTLPLSIVRSYIRAKGGSVTGALFVTADFALNPSGVSVSDSLFESDGVDCLHIGNNNTGGTSSYAFSNCRAIGNNIVDRSGAGTCVSSPFTMWIYDTSNAFNSTDGGRKGASVPF